jgi:hypothetical protein
VTVTSPTTSCAIPRVPANFAVGLAGSTVLVSWDMPAGGTPAAGYYLLVSGSYNGQFPIAGRSFAANAPPGTYTLSVRAANACGAGPATAFQTITIN